jgi:EAL domain-containing protein (putative c-di-GMP-specific phosphodiesterase class I)
VSIPVTYTSSTVTRERFARIPLARFRDASALTSASTTGVSALRELPLATRYPFGLLPSTWTKMANAPVIEGRRFPIDFAVDLKRIPLVSAADVLAGRAGAGALAGKQVLITATTRDSGDIVYAPGWGPVNGGFVIILGAETLRKGLPIALGWTIPLLVAFGLASVHFVVQRRGTTRVVGTLALGAASIIPLVLETEGVFMELAPAVILYASVAITVGWQRFRGSYKVRGNINAVSGLPNLNALREAEVPTGHVLVAARVRNFSEITTALPSGGERMLVEQIVARLSLGARNARIYQGDEGIFVWSAPPDHAGSDQLDALHALFRSPALVDGRPIDLSVTFGLDAVEADRSLANRIGATLVAADEAAAESLRWKAYDPAKLADAEWKLSLLGRLDAAIDTGEVWVAYQPQLDLTTNRIVGAEALVRWSHPEKGDVSPQEFVLAAEQHDRIDKLTEFVLSDAIRSAADFYAKGREFEVAVNISARLLERPGLVELVRGILDEARLPYERLTLEVTESAALASGRSAIRTLEELGSLGISVSIDDYGTGFSTLEYFKRIPAAEVKIDREFVASLARSSKDRLMVRSTIELAHSLGRTVVAEGVETSEILAELRTLGCDRAQGYLIGRPMKLAALQRMLVDAAKDRAA